VMEERETELPKQKTQDNGPRCLTCAAFPDSTAAFFGPLERSNCAPLSMPVWRAPLERYACRASLTKIGFEARRHCRDVIRIGRDPFC
jgi:hypothetical protein